jgi:hypothetical protein
LIAIVKILCRIVVNDAVPATTAIDGVRVNVPPLLLLPIPSGCCGFVGDPVGLARPKKCGIMVALL